MTFKDVTDVLLRILIGGWDMSLEILLKKSTILIVIVLVAQVDRMLGTDNHVFCNCTALSFTVNDALSVMENVGRMGIRFPKFLMTALEKLQHQIKVTPEQDEHSISTTDDKLNDTINSEPDKDSTGNEYAKSTHDEV